MKSIDVQTFQRYQDLSLEIAEECDSLLAEKQEVVLFAGQLRVFLGDLRGLLSSSVASEAEHSIVVPAAVFAKLTADLARMESVVGREGRQAESAPVHAQKPQGQGLSLLARKTTS